MCRKQVGFSARFNFSGPLGNHGNVNSAFSEVGFSPALLTFKRMCAVEPGGVGSPVKTWTVVAGENDEGIFIKPKFFQSGHNFAHLFIEIGNHGRVSCMRVPMREITPVAGIRFFVAKLFHVIIHPAFGRLQRHVGNGAGVIHEKGLILVFFNEMNDFILHQFRGIIGEPEVAVGIRVKRIGAFRQPGAGRNHFVVKRYFFGIFPQVHRKIGVCLPLAVVSIKKIEALFVGNAFG